MRYMMMVSFTAINHIDLCRNGSKESKYYIYQISEHAKQQYCEAEKKILDLKAMILRQTYSPTNVTGYRPVRPKEV